MEKFFIFLVAVILVVAIILGIDRGLDRQEVVECETWALEAREYQGYYILKWQDEQCKAHDIIINAPIQ